jgi:hypothetical protein
MEPDDLGPAVVIVAWVFAALAAVVVGTRLFVRLRIVPRTLRLDDYIILLTLVSLPFGTLGLLAGSHSGAHCLLQTA